ncbi:MAG: ketoacyl-ACP synthase III, partial [Bacteroidales bacterium]|nr:ketoacyl-ACP synthase III [Bacteroidales bacterium]
MSYLSIGNVKISGISACVPKEVEDVISFPLFTLDNAENFTKTTGVERRRKAPVEVCSSDLCFKAASVLIEELQWDR